MPNLHHQKQNTKVSHESTDFSKKWKVSENKYSFTQIPNTLIYCQGHLGLKDQELITLNQLIAHWFTAEGRVFPSINRLATFSGKKYSSVQRSMKALETKRFINRTPLPGGPYLIDFTPCIEKIKQHGKVCSFGLKRDVDTPAHLSYEHITRYDDYLNSL